MSVQGVYIGGVRTAEPVKLTTTAITNLYTADYDIETIAGFTVSNEHSAAVLVKIYLNDGATDYLAWLKSVDAETTEIVTDMPLKLVSGNMLKAEAAVADEVTIISIVMWDDVNATGPFGAA